MGNGVGEVGCWYGELVALYVFACCGVVVGCFCVCVGVCVGVCVCGCVYPWVSACSCACVLVFVRPSDSLFLRAPVCPFSCARLCAHDPPSPLVFLRLLEHPPIRYNS